MARAYSFARMTVADLPLVRIWLAQPHVMEWWPDPQQQAEEIEGLCHGGDTEPFIVSLASRPIAFLQCSRLGSREHGIDQFIGEAELLGQGHGSSFIRQFCDGLFQAGLALTVTTDPDPANARAVRAYEKAGFRRIGPRDTPWGHVLLMQRDHAP